MHYPKIEDPSAPAPPAPPAPMRMHVPQMQMEAPQMQMQAPPMQTQAPPMQTQVPPVQMHIPQVQMQLPPMQYQASVAPPRPQVVIGVPPMQFQAPGAWTTGLFDCFDDVGSCCLGFLCPCVAFGRVADITSRGQTSCVGSTMLWCCLLQVGLFFTGAIGFQWIYSFSSRSKLRTQFNLPEDPCCDCCVHFFCEICSLCQIYRELQNRGFDMSIGYQSNMAKLGQATMQPPQVPGVMFR